MICAQRAKLLSVASCCHPEVPEVRGVQEVRAVRADPAFPVEAAPPAAADHRVAGDELIVRTF